MRRRTLKNSFGFLAISALVVGCANEGGSASRLRNRSAIGVAEDSESNYSDYILNLERKFPTGVVCTKDEPNVEPEYDTVLDGTTGYFNACATSQSRSLFYIDGKSLIAGEPICVFPATYGPVSDQSETFGYSTFPTPGATASLPYSVCGVIPAQGFYIDVTNGIQAFPNNNVDAVFIVTSSNRAQMQNCLRMGNPYVCPSYSFGELNDRY